jgi:hypothetical protein
MSNEIVTSNIPPGCVHGFLQTATKIIVSNENVTKTTFSGDDLSTVIIIGNLQKYLPRAQQITLIAYSK